MRSRFSSSDGSHELEAINKFPRRRITNMYPRKTKSTIKDDDDEYPIVLRTDNNSMQSEILSSYRVNFTKSNNVGSR